MKASRSSISALLLAGPLGVHALPNTCAAISKVVNAVRAAPTASKFCSSYLKISTSLIVVQTLQTTTTGTTTVSTSTSTSTATTSDFAATVTPVVQLGYECTPTATITSPPSKREAEPAAASSVDLCRSFAAPLLSQACKCLNLPTPKATFISTKTVGVEAKVTAATTTTTTTTILSGTSTAPPSTSSPSFCTAGTPYSQELLCRAYNDCLKRASFGNGANTNYFMYQGLIKDSYYGDALYVPDAVLGGKIDFNFNNARPATAFTPHCDLNGDRPKCYNSLGQALLWYTPSGTNDLALGLTPTDAEKIDLYFYYT